VHEKTSVPTTREYVATSGNEVVKVLQSAAELIPVPLLRDALGVAIKVIEACEVSSPHMLKQGALTNFFNTGSYGC